MDILPSVAFGTLELIAIKSFAVIFDSDNQLGFITDQRDVDDLRISQYVVDPLPGDRKRNLLYFGEAHRYVRSGTSDRRSLADYFTGSLKIVFNFAGGVFLKSDR